MTVLELIKQYNKNTVTAQEIKIYTKYLKNPLTVNYFNTSLMSIISLYDIFNAEVNSYNYICADFTLNINI